MSALSSPQVSKLLDHLFAEAGRNDPAAFDRFDGAESKLSRPASGRLRAELMRDIYMPVTPDVGRLLYVLARNRSAKTIVEFGIIRDFRHPSGSGIARRRRWAPHYDRIRRH